MEMRRLEIFCKVVEFASFTKAAEALSLSQPTVSEHLKMLEEFFGEKLIDRLGREVLPTPAGRVFYQYAKNIVQLRDESVKALQQFKGHLAGSLTLGASTIPGTYLLPKVIGNFKSKYPAIKIVVKIADSAEIVNLILEGTIECGFIGSTWNDKRVLIEEISYDELVLAVHKGHRWSLQKQIQLQELIGEPFIIREQGSGTRKEMINIMENCGFASSRLNIVAEMGSTEAIKQGIIAGIGVSIISRQSLENEIKTGLIDIISMKNVKFMRPIHLIQRKNRQLSPLGKAFLDYIKNFQEI
jgi:DNA-binding transcriptional LysR family regulator